MWLSWPHHHGDNTSSSPSPALPEAAAGTGLSEHPLPAGSASPSPAELCHHGGSPGILLGGEALGWLWWGEPWDSSRFML